MVLSLLSKPCIFTAEELDNKSTAFDSAFSFIKQTKEQISCAECPRCYRPNKKEMSSGICTATLPLSLPVLHTENMEFVLQETKIQLNTLLLDLRLYVLAYTLFHSIPLCNIES